MAQIEKIKTPSISMNKIFGNKTFKEELQEEQKAYEEGIYCDSPANRKLGRVGMTYKEWSSKQNEKKEDKKDGKKEENNNYEQEYTDLISSQNGILNENRKKEYIESKKYLDSVKDKLTESEYNEFKQQIEKDALKGEISKLVSKGGRGREGQYEKVPYSGSKYNINKIKIQEYVDNLDNNRKWKNEQNLENEVSKIINERRTEEENKISRDRLTALIQNGKYTDNPLNRALGIVGKEDKGIYYDLDIPTEIDNKRKRSHYYTDRFYDDNNLVLNKFFSNLAKEIGINVKESDYNKISSLKSMYDKMIYSYYTYGKVPYTIEDLKMSVTGHNSPKWKKWNEEMQLRKKKISQERDKLDEQNSKKWKEEKEKLREELKKNK